MQVTNYIEAGFSVIPENSKKPCIKKWVDKATSNLEQIKKWETQFPGCEWGIVTGRKSNLLVLDIDHKNGKQPGLKNYSKLIEKYGDKWAETYTVRTPTGGLHLYFIYPENVDKIKNNEIMEAVEIKGDGGKVSISDKYKPISGIPGILLPCPKWLVDDFINNKDSTFHEKKETIIDINFRNQSMTSLCGTWRMKGLEKGEIYLLAQRANNKNFAANPLPDDEIKKIISSICQYKPGTGFLTDIGNAEKLTEIIKGYFRYCVQKKSWFMYSNGKWSVDDMLYVQTKARECIRNLFHEAAETTDKDKRATLLKFALRSENASRQNAMISLAQSMNVISVTQFDSDDYLFNMKNGTLNLNTGKFYKHVPYEYHTKQSPVEYKPDAKCPKFLAFLKLFFKGKQDIIDYLQRVLGLCLSGDTKEQHLWVLYGSGGNGKSTLVETVNYILAGYHNSLQADKLMISKFDDNDTYIAQLHGARAVFCSESSENKTLNSAIIKNMTGGDEITVRQKYEKPFTFKPRFKLFLITNHKPRIKDDSPGIWRRLRLIPFTYQISPKKAVGHYEQVLIKEEASGIFNWIYEGYRTWSKSGLECPDSVKQITSDYKKEEDFVAGFIEEKCIIKKEAHVTSANLYREFKNYLVEIGEKYYHLSQKGLIEKMKKNMVYFEQKRTTKNRVWFGIGILSMSSGDNGDMSQDF